jgi:D-3-phosphoglycerate dehydrogenase / 2-oxoglutarate reductase
MLRRLKFIGRVGSGLENIDLEFAKSKEYFLFQFTGRSLQRQPVNMPPGCLCTLNNICKANNEVKSGQWFREVNRGVEIQGKNCGHYRLWPYRKILCKVPVGFGATIIAYDKYKTGYSDEYVTESEIEDLF